MYREATRVDQRSLLPRWRSPPGPDQLSDVAARSAQVRAAGGPHRPAAGDLLAQILAAARRLIDRDGWDNLTIRRLAAETCIGATMYHHVRDKDDLLRAADRRIRTSQASRGIASSRPPS